VIDAAEELREEIIQVDAFETLKGHDHRASWSLIYPAAGSNIYYYMAYICCCICAVVLCFFFFKLMLY
jgi:hypothetical protein